MQYALELASTFTSRMEKQLIRRDAMRYLGTPSLRREVEHQFWIQIATGFTSEKAAEAVGISPAVGSRWFRHRGVISAKRFASFVFNIMSMLVQSSIRGTLPFWAHKVVFHI